MGTENRSRVFGEMKEAFGQVPTWTQSAPDQALGGFWEIMRDFQLAETEIPNKYKELIGLGVAGATRCRYCQVFHTEAARLFGATDAEIAEAAMMAGFTMMASTYMNAIAVDHDQFVRETREIVEHVRRQQQGATPAQGRKDQPRAHT